MEKKKEIVAGVYFATYGHWSLALQQAGYKVLWHVQPNIKNPNILDKFATKVLRTNFPYIPWYPVVNLNKNEPLDIIVGSPPCIGFSQGNPKSGSDHWANKNFIKCFEKIAELKPKYFLVEMVPRIFTVGQKVLKEALEYLRDYWITSKIFEISEYGCPVKRKRVYFFGAKKGENLFKYNPTLLDDLPKRGFTVPCSAILENYPNLPFADGKNLLSLLKKDGTLRKGPFGSALQKNRILDKDKPAFTITGMAFTNMKHYNGLRFLTIQEIADLMGFPADYKYITKSIGTKCKIIASGVDIRFTKLLLQHLRLNIIEGKRK